MGWGGWSGVGRGDTENCRGQREPVENRGGRGPYLGAGNVHASCVEAMLHLLDIVHLQYIVTAKLKQYTSTQMYTVHLQHVATSKLKPHTSTRVYCTPAACC